MKGLLSQCQPIERTDKVFLKVKKECLATSCQNSGDGAVVGHFGGFSESQFWALSLSIPVCNVFSQAPFFSLRFFLGHFGDVLGTRFWRLWSFCLRPVVTEGGSWVGGAVAGRV